MSMELSSVLSGSKTIVFLFLACNLVFLLANLNPQREGTGLEPVSFIASRLTAIAMAYLSASIYPSSPPHSLPSTIRRTWRRPAATLVHIELLSALPSAILLTLAAFARAGAHGAPLVIVSVAALVWVGPAVLFPYTEIACKVGVVVSVVEDGCGGTAALRRAGELVEGMQMKGMVVAAVVAAAEQVTLAVAGRGGGWWLVVAGPAHLGVKFMAGLVYTVFYYECKRRNGKLRKVAEK